MEAAQERILVRSVNWMGDAVMTTPPAPPARGETQRLYRAAGAGQACGSLDQHPAVNRVRPVAPTDTAFGVARRLRNERFDLALVLPNSPRSALEPFLARIPRRIGYPHPWRSFLLTERVQPRPGVPRMRKRSPAEIKKLVAEAAPESKQALPLRAHQSFEYLHLVASLGVPSEPLPPQLFVTAEEVEAVRQRFGLRRTRQDNPAARSESGAEYGPAKRWPRERFVAAAVEVQRRTGCRCWVFGGPADRELAESISHEIARGQTGPPGSVRSLAGQTSLRELCACLKACDVVLTNDTGPMHVAAALGTPVVVPFGSTSPELTAPGVPGDPRHALLKALSPARPVFCRNAPSTFVAWRASL
jgi:heptosyltransferase-2